MSKHTSGPWHVANDIDGGFCIEADRGTYRDEIVVARWEGGSQCRIAMSDADARLIAAAPDLLMACWSARAYVATHQHDSSAKALQQIEAAIAKATGAA